MDLGHQRAPMTADAFYRELIPRTPWDEAHGTMGGVCPRCRYPDALTVEGEHWLCSECGAGGGRLEMMQAVGYLRWMEHRQEAEGLEWL